MLISWLNSTHSIKYIRMGQDNLGSSLIYTKSFLALAALSLVTGCLQPTSSAGDLISNVDCVAGDPRVSAVKGVPGVGWKGGVRDGSQKSLHRNPGGVVGGEEGPAQLSKRAESLPVQEHGVGAGCCVKESIVSTRHVQALSRWVLVVAAR